MNRTLSAFLLFLCLSLSAFPATYRAAQSIDTIDELSTRVPSPVAGPMIEVLGYRTPGDWGPPRAFVWDSTNQLSTNAIIRQASGVVTGRWVHAWTDGAPEAFGAKAGFLEHATEAPSQVGVDSAPAIQSAIDALSAAGGGVLRLSPGTYWIGSTVFLKPRVDIVGPAPATGLYQTRSSSGPQTGRLAGLAYLEAYSPSGVGFPVIVADGRYYTNLYNASFTNEDGDSTTYHASVNTIRDIVISGYQWSWGNTNQLPMAGLVINQVAGITIDGVGFVNLAGHGIWSYGGGSMTVSRCRFLNCLEHAAFVAYSSDTTWHDNIITGSVVFYRANTHTFTGGEIWNPAHSLVNYSGETTNVSEFGRTRAYLVERTYSSDASDDTFYSASRWGAQPGRLVYFTGTDIPAPFTAKRPYFVCNTADGYKIRLSASPQDAMAGDYIDVNESKTNGLWHLTSYSAAVTAYDCEEINLTSLRMDQSYQNTVEFYDVRRSRSQMNSIWEIGTNQGSGRYNRHTGDPLFAGVYLENCADVEIIGGKLQGGYMFVNSDLYTRGTFAGVWVTNSANIQVRSVGFADLKYGVYSDSLSTVVQAGNTWTDTVMFAADSAATNGLASREWNGIYLQGTNAIVSSLIPATHTNITDFTLQALVPFGTPRTVSGGDQYEPIIFVGPSSSHTSTSMVSGSLSVYLYTQSGSTNTSLIVSLEGSVGRRRSLIDVTEEKLKGMPLNLTIGRSGSNWVIMNGGYFVNLPMNLQTGTAPDPGLAIHANYVVAGFWPQGIYRMGWFGPISLWKAYNPYEPIRDGGTVKGGPDLVFRWDWRGASGTTVEDRSENNVDATVITLDSTSLAYFGPATVPTSFSTGGGGGGAYGTNDYTGQIVTADAFNRVIKALSAGTVLTNNQHYTVALSADRTLTFSGTPADGDEISLYATNGVDVTLSFPSSVDGTGGGTVTSVYLLPGHHELSWLRKDSKWVFVGTGLQISIDGSAVGLAFTATNSAGLRTYSASVSSPSTFRTAIGADDAGNLTIGTVDPDRLPANVQALDSAGYTGTGPFLRESAAVGGGFDVSGTGVSSNATAFTLWTTNVASGQSLTAEILATGAGPTNSVTAKLLVTAFNRSPGGASIRTNAPLLSSGTASADAWFSLSGSDLVLNARGAADENFNWSYKGTSISQAHGITNAGGGTLLGLSKSNLLALYLFADATDSHNVGPFNLTETNSPTYSSGLLLTRASNTSFVQQASVTAHFLTNSAEPTTVAYRIRADSGIASGSYGLYSHGSRLTFRYVTSSNTVKIAQNSSTTYTVAPVTNQWWNVVALYDGTTNRRVIINGVEFNQAETFATTAGPLLIGTDSTSGAYARNFSFDWMGIWKRALTSNEIAYLTGITNDNAFTYSQLDP